MEMRQKQLLQQQRLERKRLEFEQEASNLKIQDEVQQATLEADLWGQLEAEEGENSGSVEKAVEEHMVQLKASSNHSDGDPSPGAVK